MFFWFWKSNHPKTIWFLILFRRNVAFWPYCHNFRSKTNNFDNTVIICFARKTQKHITVLSKWHASAKKYWKPYGFCMFWLPKSKITVFETFLARAINFDHTVIIFNETLSILTILLPFSSPAGSASQARPGVGPHLATAARPRGGGTAPDQLQAPIKSSAGLFLKERA